MQQRTLQGTPQCCCCPARQWRSLPPTACAGVTSFAGHIYGSFPPGRIGSVAGHARHMLCMLRAHTQAYDLIKALPGGWAGGWPAWGGVCGLRRCWGCMGRPVCLAHKRAWVGSVSMPEGTAGRHAGGSEGLWTGACVPSSKHCLAPARLHRAAPRASPQAAATSRWALCGTTFGLSPSAPPGRPSTCPGSGGAGRGGGNGGKLGRSRGGVTGKVQVTQAAVSICAACSLPPASSCPPADAVRERWPQRTSPRPPPLQPPADAGVGQRRVRPLPADRGV